MWTFVIKNNCIIFYNSFKNIRIIDTTQTTIKEQRITEWMKFESLTNFLNQHDINKTIEGYPAPVRVIVISEKP